MLVIEPKRVRARLALMGWTQGDLAQELGMSAWELSRVMQGHALLTEPEILDMARVLQVGVEEIATRYAKVT